MGASVSVEGNFFLQTVLSREALPQPMHNFFASGLAALPETLLMVDNASLRQKCQDAQLLDHNLESRRIHDIFAYMSTVLDASVCNRSVGAPFAPLALRLCHALTQYAIGACNGDAILLAKHLNHNGSGAKLCGFALKFISEVPMDSETAVCHAEVLLLLFTFTSTVLHRHPCTEYSELHADIFTESMLASDGLPTTMLVLLERVVSWGNDMLPSSQYLYGQGPAPRLLNLYNLFGVWRRETRINIGEIIGRRSLHLLLSLVMHRKGDDTVVNNALEGLCRWRDGQEISFSLLFAAITNKIGQFPEMLQLLYLFVHDHPLFFKATLMQQSPVEIAELLLQLCYHMYNAPDSMMLYMVCTLFLVFSEDGSLNNAMHDWMVSAPWYRERYLGHISVGSLVIACCVRTVARGVLTEKSTSLTSLALGALANFCPFVHSLDTYAAQRMVYLMGAMSKRVMKLQHMADDDNYGVLSELKLQAEFLEMYMECVYNTVASTTTRNANLMYEMLYQKEILAPAAEMPSLVTSVTKVTKLMGYYETELMSVSQNHTADEIIALIKQVAEAGVPETIYQSDAAFADEEDGAPLMYQYEEMPNAHVFFLPMLWNIASCKETATAAWGDVRDLPLFAEDL